MGLIVGAPSPPDAPGHPRGHLVYRILTVVTAAWTYGTILLGANVMATDSGLDCPSWPTCDGSSITPLSFQGGVVLEFSHRLAAFSLSLLILALFVVAVLYERRRPALIRVSALAFLMVVAQALLGGAIIVTQEQNLIVVAHLGLATLLFGLLAVLAMLVNLPYFPRGWLARFSGSGEELTYLKVPGPREPPESQPSEAGGSHGGEAPSALHP